ncbi:MAG: DUF488 domain-containing protein [Thermoflexales bacterium]
MLFERQRLLLTLLDAIGRSVGHTDFQKLLFLFSQDGDAVPSYEFVPYKFGAFSLTSHADKRKLIAEGLLAGDEHNWTLTPEGRKIARERPAQATRVAAFCEDHAGLRGDALIVEQYRRYPYYASHSEILDRLPLDPDTRLRIRGARPMPQPAGLVTIGYEGRSLEAYLNALLGDGVTLLCDVRRNPFSHKYGFSKSTLANACLGVDIRYEHLPQLGIASEERQALASQADRDALFDRYARTTLRAEKASLEQILGWVDSGNRVALTCFESLPEQCHRHCVSEALSALRDEMLLAKHL